MSNDPLSLPKLPTDPAVLARLDPKKDGPFAIDVPLGLWATSEWYRGFSRWEWIKWRLDWPGLRWRKTCELIDLIDKEERGELIVRGCKR